MLILHWNIPILNKWFQRIEKRLFWNSFYKGYINQSSTREIEPVEDIYREIYCKELIDLGDCGDWQGMSEIHRARHQEKVAETHGCELKLLSTDGIYTFWGKSKFCS